MVARHVWDSGSAAGSSNHWSHGLESRMKPWAVREGVSYRHRADTPDMGGDGRKRRGQAGSGTRPHHVKEEKRQGGDDVNGVKDAADGSKKRTSR